MTLNGRIDDLIERGWGVIDSDFDPKAFRHWRRSAFDCLSEMLGPDHMYTRQFENFVQQGTKTDLLVSADILSAAKHGIAGQGYELIPATINPNTAHDLTENTRGATTGCG